MRIALKPPPSPLLTTIQAAELLGMKEQTLHKWRCEKTVDLPFVKIGGAIRYKLSDLQKFISAHTVSGR